MSEPKPPVLVILHQETSIPGRVGDLLVARGYDLDIRRPRFDDPLPGSLEEHTGAVIFGGPMSANDPDEFIKQEIDWISVPLKEQKPFLGICLGGQMLSKQLGGVVTPHRDDLVEIGYYAIEGTKEGADLLNWPEQVYQWHNEGFTLPSGAQLMASGETFTNQAFRYDSKAWGVQFHPEVTMDMMDHWTTVASDRLTLPGAQSREAHFNGRKAYDPAVERWLNDFLDMWLSDDMEPAFAG